MFRGRVQNLKPDLGTYPNPKHTPTLNPVNPNEMRACFPQALHLSEEGLKAGELEGWGME